MTGLARSPAASVRWHPWLAVLLPFTALGLLPWWVCLAQCAALTVGRLNDNARSIGFLLVVLGATAAALTRLPDLISTGTLFVGGALLGAAGLLSLNLLEHGRPIGLLPGTAALLLAPTPVGLIALLLAALSTGGPDGVPARRLDRPGTLPALLGAVLLLGVLCLLLPAAPAPPGIHPSTATTQPGTPAAPSPTLTPGSTVNSGPSAAPPPRTRLMLDLPWSPFSESMWLLAGLLMVICMLLLLRQAQAARRAQRSGWAEYVAAVGLLALLLMLFVVGLGTRSGGQGQQALSDAPQRTRADIVTTVPPDRVTTLVLDVGAGVAVLVFGALAALLWAASRERAGSLKAAPASASPAGVHPSPDLPLHRVRRAWQQAEAALGSAGLGRHPSEAPEAYRDRLAPLVPALHAPLSTLTDLYLPVRYGGDLSEQDAEQAEQAARQIMALIPSLPKRDDDD
ncbi:DUF4129 domain-containing protein [Deinococcus sonorensis]|uniref:DUF4129 domain-containing protein n=2 Tax=Deinococcus sonorensis TaxID=309891 RepID=A0AAU7UBU9_9DEIO